MGAVCHRNMLCTTSSRTVSSFLNTNIEFLNLRVHPERVRYKEAPPVDSDNMINPGNGAGGDLE